MTRFRKLTAVLLSVIMLVCMFAVPASAANTVKLESGKEVDVHLKNGKSASYKITTKETGDISIAILTTGEFTEITLADSNGKALTVDKADTEFGTADGANTKKATLIWDAPDDKPHNPPAYKGVVYYRDADAGTYTLKIKNANGLELESAITFTATFRNEVTLTGYSFSITLKKGETFTLDAIIDGAVDGKVKWSSSKKSVASVSSKGVVKAKKKGTAVITATLGKSTAQITVIVTA